MQVPSFLSGCLLTFPRRTPTSSYNHVYASWRSSVRLPLPYIRPSSLGNLSVCGCNPWICWCLTVDGESTATGEIKKQKPFLNAIDDHQGELWSQLVLDSVSSKLELARRHALCYKMTAGGNGIGFLGLFFQLGGSAAGRIWVVSESEGQNLGRMRTELLNCDPFSSVAVR